MRKGSKVDETVATLHCSQQAMIVLGDVYAKEVAGFLISDSFGQIDLDDSVGTAQLENSLSCLCLVLMAFFLAIGNDYPTNDACLALR